MYIKRILQIGNILAVIITIIVNGLANILPINGKYTGELSDAIPNLFVPAGLTFSIWGIIYVLLILFVIYQARDLFKTEKLDLPFLDQIHIFFIISCVLNIIWVFLWHYQQILASLLIMILLFLTLLMIYLRLNIGLTNPPIKKRLLVHVPFSVYIGWITVATIANVTAALVTIGWDGFGIGQEIWTVLVLIIATLITVGVIIKRRDIAYSLVIIWALLGIYIKRIQVDPIYGIQPLIAYTAGILIIVIIVMLISVHSKKLLKA